MSRKDDCCVITYADVSTASEGRLTAAAQPRGHAQTVLGHDLSRLGSSAPVVPAGEGVLQDTLAAVHPCSGVCHGCLQCCSVTLTWRQLDLHPDEAVAHRIEVRGPSVGARVEHGQVVGVKTVFIGGAVDVIVGTDGEGEEALQKRKSN